MRKNWWSKALSFFMAFLLVLIPSYSSIADQSFTGLKNENGKQRSYIDGVLVTDAVSRVKNVLYYSDQNGNITAKITVKEGQNYQVVERQKGYATAYDADNSVNSNSTVIPGSYFIYKVFEGAFNISSVKDTPGFWIKAEDSQKNMFEQFKGMDLSPKANAQIANDGTYKLLNKVSGYFSAYDALGKTNAKVTLNPGNYYIYKSVDGAINLTTVKGVPGSWINAEGNKAPSQVVSTPTKTQEASGSIQADGRYKLEAKTSGYVTAADAMSKTSPVTTMEAGTYYVFKVFEGAVNISTVKGQAGAWINAKATAVKEKAPVKVSKPSPVVETQTTAGSLTSDGKIKLANKTAGYMNAENAVSKTSPVVTMEAGTYYVFKTYKGAINISVEKNAAGAWINASVIKKAAEAPKSQKIVEASKAQANVSAGSGYKLSKSVSGYMTAYDAIAGKTPITSVSAGNYYVYKAHEGALNLTVVKGQAGTWINPKEAKSQVVQSPAPVSKPISSINVSEGSSFKLSAQTPGYVSADDAKAASNSNSIVPTGTYYVYKIASNGAINISSDRNVAGFWIMPGQKVNVSKPQPSPVKAQPSPIVANTSDKFVIAIDPGHGAGIAHNRGGLLFNEGDQNFVFSQYFMAEARQYKNVVVRTTRPTINYDPSLEERGAFGAGADLYLSLHTNAMPVTYSTSGQIIRGDNVRGVEVHSSHYSQNINMAYQITNMVSNLLGTPNRGVKFPSYDGSVYGRPMAGQTDYFAVFRHGNTASTRYLIEFVFHTNLQDSQAYLNNQQALARNLMQIIAQNYNLTK